MKLKKYIHIRNKTTEKQQIIPLYSLKDDVGHPAIALLDGKDKVYAKLLKKEGPLSSKLHVRADNKTYTAEKLDVADTLPLTRLHYVMKYTPELQKGFEQKKDELTKAMLSAGSSKERTRLGVERGRYEHLATVTEFSHTVYKNDHAKIPNPLNTSELDDMSYMFYGCKELENVQELDTSRVMDMRSMFEGCRKLPSIFPWYIDASKMDEIEKYRDMFKDSSVKKAFFKNVPENMKALIPVSAELMGLESSQMAENVMTAEKYKMKDLYPDPYRTAESFDGPFGVLGMKSIAEMYDGCEKLETLVAFDTASIQDFNSMFRGCASLPEVFPYAIDISGIKSSNGLRDMFAESSVKSAWFKTTSPQPTYYISRSLLGSGVSSKVDVIMSEGNRRFKMLFPETYEEMSESCQHPNKALESDILPADNMKDASFMFEGCTNLVEMNSERLLALHGLKNTSAMFQDCESLEAMPPIDTSEVVNMAYMFSGCMMLFDVAPIDTRSARDMSYMFCDCESLPETYPYMLDVENVRYVDGFEQMFGNSSVKEVSLLNVDTSVRNELEPSWLGDNVETIRYYMSLDWIVQDSELRKLDIYDSIVIRDNEHTLGEIEGFEEVSELVFQNVTDASNVIGTCDSFRNIGAFTGLGRIKNMAGMFSGCRHLQELPPVDVKSIPDSQAMKDFIKGTCIKKVTLLNACEKLREELTPEILGSGDIKISYE